MFIEKWFLRMAACYQLLWFKRAITFTLLYRLPNPQWGNCYRDTLLSLAYSVMMPPKQDRPVKVK